MAPLEWVVIYLIQLASRRHLPTFTLAIFLSSSPIDSIDLACVGVLQMALLAWEVSDSSSTIRLQLLHPLIQPHVCLALLLSRFFAVDGTAGMGILLALAHVAASPLIANYLVV